MIRTLAGRSGESQAILDLSFSEGRAGVALGRLGETREALAILRKAAAGQEFLANKDPNDDLIYGHLANSYTRLAHCLLQSGDTKAAVSYYRRALAARLRLSTKSFGGNANRVALAECYTNLGKAVATGNPADALEPYNRAIELLDSVIATGVNNAQYRIRLADALTSAARLYVRIASASNETYPIRLQQWNHAQSLYQRSHGLWQDLNRSGRLGVADRRGPTEAAQELASCNNSLAKLQQNR